jgi:hypothetical protein
MPLERFERLQRVMRAALAILERRRPVVGALDEQFYADLRAVLLEAGAADTEIDAVSAFTAALIVGSTEPDSELRLEQLELIGEHLSQTDMDVSLARDGRCVGVRFPQRPAVH